ncbi:MAG TPA: hypothetical protein VII98_11705 [Solirubrobacteraceae bacterium]
MTFLRNVWADMVEKRLWPLAVALLVGIVAVPTVLAKKNAQHDTQQVVATAAANHASSAPGEAAVALDTSAAATARRDHLGRQRNPFDQLFAPKVRPLASSSTGAATTTTGSGTTGGSTGSGGGSTGGGTTPPKQPATTKTAYSVSLHFGEAGAMHTIRDIPRLTPLPSAVDPFFVFLGVKDDGRTAIFLVSSDAKATGDGACKPSDSDCETIELKAGDTEFFDLTTATGVQQFQMDLVSITKRTVTSAAAAKAAHARASRIGTGMLQEARRAGDLPVQLGWYRWDPAAGVLHPMRSNALTG